MFKIPQILCIQNSVFNSKSNVCIDKQFDFEEAPHNQIKPIKPKVLLLLLQSSDQLTPKILLNLFGCFGNVKKLFLCRKKNFSLIEY